MGLELEVERLLRELSSAWNAGDAAAFGACFADDADFVSILGEHFRTRAVIESGHARVFRSIYKDSCVAYELERVRCPAPDLAVAIIRARLISAVDRDVDDPARQARKDGNTGMAEARTTLVLARGDGGWQIVSCQNTKVGVVAQSH